MRGFTWAQYTLGPTAAVALTALLLQIRSTNPKSKSIDRSAPAIRCLILSVLVFGVGGLLGLFVDGGDTRTPAHYHGVIAGVTLALMGLAFLEFLPALGRPVPSRRRMAWTVGLFGWGQLAACMGLFLAGGHGAPRKVAGADQGLTEWAAFAGMGLNGLGGLVAVVGGILFVWTMAVALIRPGMISQEEGAASRLEAGLGASGRGSVGK
ncbi:MAG: cbb3-type cytochrome c oxidase subunit I [Rhodospirillales bacterium]|nr:cbb3-type cytochrome c oxidase subunit I [Rhodospirillales bacterium]